MAEATMMRCGHAANAEQGGRPVCVICCGVRAGWDEVDPDPPSLEGREMRCPDCGATRPSDPGGAFFGRRPGAGPDTFYDGCRGWD